MVEWICNGCGNYNSEPLGFMRKELTCQNPNCKLLKGATPRKKIALPTPEETHRILSEELAKPMPAPPAAKQYQYEEPLPAMPPREPIDDRDPRCVLGAHVCRYCTTGFLVEKEEHDQASLPVELRGVKRR